MRFTDINVGNRCLVSRNRKQTLARKSEARIITTIYRIVLKFEECRYRMKKKWEKFIMEKYGIKISNYKCFDNPIGFDEIKPINVIIGKNNIGKSSLIDMVEFHYDMENIIMNVKIILS